MSDRYVSEPEQYRTIIKPFREIPAKTNWEEAGNCSGQYPARRNGWILSKLRIWSKKCDR